MYIQCTTDRVVGHGRGLKGSSWVIQSLLGAEVQQLSLLLFLFLSPTLLRAGPSPKIAGKVIAFGCSTITSNF